MDESSNDCISNDILYSIIINTVNENKSLKCFDRSLSFTHTFFLSKIFIGNNEIYNRRVIKNFTPRKSATKIATS